MTVNEITEAIIGAAIEVYRALGPGLLESAYAQCLCYELHLQGLPFGFWAWRNSHPAGPQSPRRRGDAERFPHPRLS